MKFSVAAVLALATAVFAQPRLTNSQFDVQEGKPFQITWENAQGPVTITLKTGPEGNLSTVTVIKSGITGDSFTWTPEGLPSGTYAFQIDDSSKVPNYSKQFSYEGTGPALSSTSGTATSTGVSSTTSATSSKSSSSSTITSSASESTHSSSSITTSASKTSTSTRAPANTVVNNNPSEGQRFSSPLALLLVTVAGVIFFN